MLSFDLLWIIIDRPGVLEIDIIQWICDWTRSIVRMRGVDIIKNVIHNDYRLNIKNIFVSGVTCTQQYRSVLFSFWTIVVTRYYRADCCRIQLHRAYYWDTVEMWKRFERQVYRHYQNNNTDGRTVIILRKQSTSREHVFKCHVFFLPVKNNNQK